MDLIMKTCMNLFVVAQIIEQNAQGPGVTTMRSCQIQRVFMIACLTTHL